MRYVSDISNNILGNYVILANTVPELQENLNSAVSMLDSSLYYGSQAIMAVGVGVLLWNASRWLGSYQSKNTPINPELSGRLRYDESQNQQ